MSCQIHLLFIVGFCIISSFSIPMGHGNDGGEWDDDDFDPTQIPMGADISYGLNYDPMQTFRSGDLEDWQTHNLYQYQPNASGAASNSSGQYSLPNELLETGNVSTAGTTARQDIGNILIQKMVNTKKETIPKPLFTRVIKKLIKSVEKSDVDKYAKEDELPISSWMYVYNQIMDQKRNILLSNLGRRTGGDIAPQMAISLLNTNGYPDNTWGFIQKNLGLGQNDGVNKSDFLNQL